MEGNKVNNVAAAGGQKWKLNMGGNTDDWLWRVTPLAAILVMRLGWEISRRGWGKVDWLANVVFGVGWVVGYVLAELDDWFYIYIINDQELTAQRVKKEVAQRHFRKAWELVRETREERAKRPVRNVLTGLVVAAVGVWIVISSGSLLGCGVVTSLTLRLFKEFVSDKDYLKWYWPIARTFSPAENRGIVAAWAVAAGIQIIAVIGA